MSDTPSLSSSGASADISRWKRFIKRARQTSLSTLFQRSSRPPKRSHIFQFRKLIGVSGPREADSVDSLGTSQSSDSDELHGYLHRSGSDERYEDSLHSSGSDDSHDGSHSSDSDEPHDDSDARNAQSGGLARLRGRNASRVAVDIGTQNADQQAAETAETDSGAKQASDSSAANVTKPRNGPLSPVMEEERSDSESRAIEDSSGEKESCESTEPANVDKGKQRLVEESPDVLPNSSDMTPLPSSPRPPPATGDDFAWQSFAKEGEKPITCPHCKSGFLLDLTGQTSCTPTSGSASMNTESSRVDHASTSTSYGSMVQVASHNNASTSRLASPTITDSAAGPSNSAITSTSFIARAPAGRPRSATESDLPRPITTRADASTASADVPSPLLHTRASSAPGLALPRNEAHRAHVIRRERPHQRSASTTTESCPMHVHVYDSTEGRTHTISVSVTLPDALLLEQSPQPDRPASNPNRWNGLSASGSQPPSSPTSGAALRILKAPEENLTVTYDKGLPTIQKRDLGRIERLIRFHVLVLLKAFFAQTKGTSGELHVKEEDLLR